MPEMIYHWCPRWDWDAATDEYLAPSLETEGFIHCSHRDQVERTATNLERWNRGLVILAIDPTGLSLVEEDLYDAGDLPPRLLGDPGRGREGGSTVRARARRIVSTSTRSIGPPARLSRSRAR
ncbi:MAG: DUF952 domain-containing protein [Acidimicrobiia bacterium]